MEYYIYHIPVFLLQPCVEQVSVPDFCTKVEEVLPSALLAKADIEVVYIGNFEDLKGRNAAYTSGAIYITNTEPTEYDMLENFVHETAHALEPVYGWQIYDDKLVQEFKGKRRRLKSILDSSGYHLDDMLFDFTEYNEKFDNFLAHEVGYPTLLSLTMGLFTSPYGATSLQEYFANGFEKYFLGNYRTVRDTSPVLYQKIVEVVNDDQDTA